MGREARRKARNRPQRVMPATPTAGAAAVETRPNLHLSYYLVAYIDLLGQSDELLKITHLPQNEEEEKAVLTAIKNSAIKVRAVRSAFGGLIKSAAETTQEGLNAVVPEHHAAFLSLRSIRVTHRGFSDSIVITVPLFAGEEPEGTARGVTGVWTVLFGIAGISLVALSLGVPMRAGIEVGLGLDVFEDEVYGPVIVDAYNLESMVADYPRSVIGPKLLNYLAEVRALPPRAPFSRYAIKQAADCDLLIHKDPDDGRPMLHILSPALTETAPQLAEFRAPAEAWIESQLRRFQDDGNEKLAGRYSRLVKYFAAHSGNESPSSRKRRNG